MRKKIRKAAKQAKRKSEQATYAYSYEEASYYEGMCHAYQHTLKMMEEKK